MKNDALRYVSGGFDIGVGKDTTGLHIYRSNPHGKPTYTIYDEVLTMDHQVLDSIYRNRIDPRIMMLRVIKTEVNPNCTITLGVTPMTTKKEKPKKNPLLRRSKTALIKRIDELLRTVSAAEREVSELSYHNNVLQKTIKERDQQIVSQNQQIEALRINIARLEGYIEHSTQQQNAQYVNNGYQCATLSDVPTTPTGQQYLTPKPFRAPAIDYPYESSMNRGGWLRNN